MIQEHAYLHYFCGYREYDDSRPPFDQSLMVYFRKRLTPEVLGEINEMIIARAQKPKPEENKDSVENYDNDDDEPGNGGTMIVDATCAPSNIKYPQDMTLLNEARECAEKIIDALHTPGEAKPRTYREKARADYLRFARKRSRNRAFMRKSIKKQLSYILRDLAHIDAMPANGKVLSEKLSKRLETIRKVYEQ